MAVYLAPHHKRLDIASFHAQFQTAANGGETFKAVGTGDKMIPTIRRFGPSLPPADSMPTTATTVNQCRAERLAEFARCAKFGSSRTSKAA